MGYRIEYADFRTRKNLENRRNQTGLLTGLFFLLFLFLSVSFWPEGRQLLQQLVFPGDIAVTTAALEALSSELQQGISLTEALESFCLRILEGAEFVLT